MPTGYKDPNKNTTKYEPVIENTYVGCKNCGQTWREDYCHTSPVRVNGALKIYDCCDSCYDIDKQEYKKTSALSRLIKDAITWT